MIPVTAHVVNDGNNSAHPRWDAPARLHDWTARFIGNATLPQLIVDDPKKAAFSDEPSSSATKRSDLHTPQQALWIYISPTCNDGYTAWRTLPAITRSNGQPKLRYSIRLYNLLAEQPSRQSCSYHFCALQQLPRHCKLFWTKFLTILQYAYYVESSHLFYANCV